MFVQYGDMRIFFIPVCSSLANLAGGAEKRRGLNGSQGDKGQCFVFQYENNS
jgi:hypothetical protein